MKKYLIRLTPLLYLLGALDALAATRLVCNVSGTYPTIGAAVTAAGNGDVIRICPGTYNGSVNVTKSNLTFQSSTGNRADVVVTSDGTTFSISGSSVTIKDLTIVSDKDKGIETLWSATGTHVFQNLAVTAKNTGIYIDNGGTQTFRNLTIDSSHGKGIELAFNANGNHVFENLAVTAKEHGIHVNNGGTQTFRNLTVESSNGTGIQLEYNATGNHVFEKLKVTSKETAIVVLQSQQVKLDRVCVSSAKGHGAYFPWNARNVTVKDSIFKANGDDGIRIESDPAAPAHVNNSCFYQARCAWSSSSAHDFSGNFWAPANCNNNANVTATSPLAACPLVESSCYTPGGGGEVVPGTFNAFDTNTVTGAIAGVIKTKIAAQAFDLAVLALNAAKNAGEPAFTGDVKLELLGNTALNVPLDADNCPQNATVLATWTLSFVAGDNGRKNTSVAAQPNAWRNVRVRISYPATASPTRVACSSDNFALRPATLSAPLAHDADWQTAGTGRTLNNTNANGGTVHKAGRPFTLTTSARNAAGAVTTNYAGSPTVSTLSCILPATNCVSNNLEPGTWSASGGQVATATASYAEAGSFNLTLVDKEFASVDANDSSDLERHIPQAGVAVIGRFVPDHFVLAMRAGNTPRFRTFNDAACALRSFTYIGQPFGYAQPPEITVTARNATGATTSNYSGSLWKLTATDVTQTYASTMPRTPDNINLPQISPNPSIPGTGTIAVNSGDTLTFARSQATPQEPFVADIGLTVSLKDAAEAGSGQGTITNIAPLLFKGDGTGIAFDAGNLFRYGRLQIRNAHGSALLNLPVPLTAQFWSANRFATNAEDHCTVLNSTNIAIRTYRGGLSATNLPQSNITGPGRLQDGTGKIIVARPLAALAATGSIDLCVDLGAGEPAATTCTAAASGPAWLKGAWTQPQYLEDPASRATFGIYKGGPIIYMREMY